MWMYDQLKKKKKLFMCFIFVWKFVSSTSGILQFELFVKCKGKS
jgi:hypothetical protein